MLNLPEAAISIFRRKSTVSLVRAPSRCCLVSENGATERTFQSSTRNPCRFLLQVVGVLMSEVACATPFSKDDVRGACSSRSCIDKGIHARHAPAGRTIIRREGQKLHISQQLHSHGTISLHLLSTFRPDDRTSRTSRLPTRTAWTTDAVAFTSLAVILIRCRGTTCSRHSLT